MYASPQDRPQEVRLRPRVVFADDHAVFRDGMDRALAREGSFDVVAVCADGTEALTAIESHRPDVALLDIHMPGLSGLEVLARVRSRPELEGITIVLLSASDDVAALGLQHGADLGLGKSLTRSQIIAEVRGALPFAAAA